MSFRTGIGFDVHRLAEGRRLILGGVNIPSDKGCIAHSDGDVLIHALCDALLGAAALGDIGLHFPDTSDEFKNIDSKILLERVISLIEKEGYRICNVDCVVALEKPKIREYVDKIRLSLAEVIRADISIISVKATTTEKLGFTGRGEGISAWATVLISKD